ncbi:hypothetical protein ACER0C_022310 [Sarotherodon galilaeus]
MADSSSVTSSGERGYKPLKQQLEQLKRAIRLAAHEASKSVEKECQAMEAEVSKFIASQQKGLEDKIALNIVLKAEGERCEQKIKQLEKESEGRSVNRKVKGEIKDLKTKHTQCCKWLFLWNAECSWMKEEKEDATGKTEDMVSIMESLKQLKQEHKTLEDQMKKLTPKAEEANKDHTQKLYPWATLTPSAPPPPYVMPMMTFEGGHVRGPEGQTGVVLGGVADVQYVSAPLTVPREGFSAVDTQSIDGGGTMASAADVRSSLPPNSLTGGDVAQEEDPMEGPSRPESRAELTSPMEDMTSPGDVLPLSKFKELPTPARGAPVRTGKLAKPKKERWEGQVHGRMNEDERGLLEVLKTLNVVRQKTAKEMAKVEKAACVTSSEEGSDEEEDMTEEVESDPGPSISLRNRTVGKKPTKQKPLGERGVRRSMFDHSEGQGGQGKDRTVNPEPKSVMPLIVGPKQQPIYRAYKVRDLEALASQLPPITEGGASWLRKLAALTEGDELAIGNFRALAGRSMVGGGLADVEEIAKTTEYPNDVPYYRVQNEIAKAVREKYPAPNTGAIPKIIWDPKYAPREFLAKAREQWLSETGIHPGQEGEHRAWFHAAVLAGLPKQVTADLERNPDFAVADSVQWERHVTHRLQSEQDTANKQKKELEEAQAQLVKLQLIEARDKAGEKKKEAKENIKKMMVASPQPDPVPDWPDLDPNLYPDDRWPANAPRQRQPAGNWGTGGPQTGRGGFVRGGQRAQSAGNPSNTAWTTGCHRCGAQGHWARNCPNPIPSYQGRGYPPQARGSPRGRGGFRGDTPFRGAHQAPNPNAAPAAQYPVVNWGWWGEQF